MKTYYAIKRYRSIFGKNKTDTVGNGFATEVFDSSAEADERIKELNEAVYVPENGETGRPSYLVIPFEHYPPTRG